MEELLKGVNPKSVDITDYLGKKYRDKITDYEGVCTYVAFGFSEINLYLEAYKDGTNYCECWFEFNRLEEVEVNE